MIEVDLQELARRESERVEWKENVADIASLVQTAVAFSNDFSNLGGGYIVCGAREGKDKDGFQKVTLVGLTADRFAEIEKHALAHCRDRVDPPIVPLIAEVPLPSPSERRVLVFIVPATSYAHSYKSDSKEASKYFIRVSRDTIEARNGLLRELLVRKGALEPWDRRPNNSATAADIDLVLLRDTLQEMGVWDGSKGIEDYLSPKMALSPFAPSLIASATPPRPRNYTLLLFSRAPTKFFPGAFTIFSVYPGTDRSENVAERLDISGPVIDQTRKVLERMNTQLYTVFDKTSAAPNLQKYPARALQEAVVNAIVHRDYENDQPTRITVFSDRIEILSPGALPRAIDKQQFVHGKSAPYWRNQSLAYFFSKTQLAQAEGQGIPTILRTMHDAGCPDPIFQFLEESVTCVLPAHPRHKQMRQLHEIEQQIVLGDAQQAIDALELILRNDPYNYRAIELYCEAANALRKPDLVLSFVRQTKIDLSKFHSGSQILLAETLLSVTNSKDAKEFANSLLAQVSHSRVEENELRRIAIGIRKLGDDARAMRFIDEMMQKVPNLQNSAPLLEIRAKAKIQLAKRCMNSARKGRLSGKLRARAWDECRRFIDEADRDLQAALDNATGTMLRQYIEDDISFLQRMKDWAKKPSGYVRGGNHKRFHGKPRPSGGSGSGPA